jgi:hypothetical protein
LKFVLYKLFHIFAAALKKKKNIDLGIEGFGEAGFFDKEGRQAGGRKRVLIILPGTKEVLTLTSRLTPGGIKGREIRVGFGRCFFGFGITREDIPGLSREKRVL